MEKSENLEIRTVSRVSFYAVMRLPINVFLAFGNICIAAVQKKVFD